MNSRKIFFIPFFLLIVGLSVTVSAQEDPKKEVVYTGIVESGFIYSPDFFNFQQTIVQGIRINQQHSIGLGVGFSIPEGEFAMPLYLNYRMNFQPQSCSPFFNVALGSLMTQTSPGFYSTLTGGVSIYNFTLSSGISMISMYGYSHPGFVLQIGIHF